MTVAPTRCTLDVDGDEAATIADTLLIARAVMGFSGIALTQNELGTNAVRRAPVDVSHFLWLSCGLMPPI